MVLMTMCGGVNLFEAQNYVCYFFYFWVFVTRAYFYYNLCIYEKSFLFTFFFNVLHLMVGLTFFSMQADVTFARPVKIFSADLIEEK